jgi:hypothetical protein
MYARLRHHSFWSLEKTFASKPLASLATKKAFPSQPSIRRPSKFESFTLASSRRSANKRAISTTSKLNFKTTTMNGTNGTTRAKRKQHPGSGAERPQKQHRPINGKDSAGQNTPEVGSMFDDEIEIEIEEPRVLATMADTAEWQAAIEKVVRNVVSIRFCQTCSFDTDPALTSEATGFVVDAERGFVAKSDPGR